MNTPEELASDQDPDYVSARSNNSLQQNINEKDAIYLQKVISIIQKEFALEINNKEKEILKIHEQSEQAFRFLNFLRYVLVTDFYNHKQCQVSQTTKITKQTRIHPAIKSVLGKYPKLDTDFAVPSTSKDPRFLYNDASSEANIQTTSSINSVPEIEENAHEHNKVLQSKKRTLSDEESPPRKVPRYVPPKCSVPENVCPSRGNSHKVCKLIIVGNVSTWIAPLWREDKSSHKWIIYVRGDKDNPDISAFINKVRFFLHPSYCPNDIVDVKEYPFNLCRRGWGEFPVRVQLHFKNSLNKPLDIIHQLKLDRTHTGNQQFGSETQVKIWIHTIESHFNLEQNSDNKSIVSFTNDINDASMKIKSNDAPECQQTERSEVAQLVPCTFDKVQVKQEGIKQEETNNLKVCEELTSKLYLNKKSEDVEVKVEPNNMTVAIDKTNKNESYKKPYQYIELDHDYYNKSYSSYHWIVNEGNMTIKHFSEENNESSLAIDSSVKPINSNEMKENLDNDLAPYRFNGLRSANELKIVNSVVSKLAKETEKAECQNNNTQASPLLLDTMTTSQVKYSQNNDNLKISENTSAKDTSMTINGICKSSDVSSISDQLNYEQKITDSLKCNSHLKPLQIIIPSLAPSNKHVLLLNDKKSIPIDMFSTNSKFDNGNAKIPITKMNIHISHGVSILKKPPNNKTNAQHKNTSNNSKNTVLVLKNTNSILLNSKEDVPILKMVDPNDPRYNYNLTNICLDSGSSIGRQEVCAKLEKPLMQRAKITLGKDKYKIQSKRNLYEIVLRSIDTANITDTETLIRYVIRRLPIVTLDACDAEYRQLHPYACRNEEEFFAYNIGKRRALEWNRAKRIRYFLQKKLISDQLWSVKEILVWARFNGYTPIRGIIHSIKNPVEATDNAKNVPDISASTSEVVAFDSCTESVSLQKWLQTCKEKSNHQSTDDYINVEEVDMEKDVVYGTTIDRRKKNSVQNRNDSTVSTLIPLELDESLLPLHNFVCDSAHNLGIKIESEEIVPGVQYCATSRVIMRVLECFVEDLTRSSLHLARVREKISYNKYPEVIMLNDVRNALMNREEFDIFTNEGLGSRQQLNMTDLSNL